MSERTLILLRHAKSDWSGDEADIDRRLATRGRREAPEAGQWLRANIDTIDLAIVSPARRARTTWKLVSAELEATPRTEIDDRVYAATGDELLNLLRELPDDLDTVVLIGHNPAIEDLTSRLAGELVPMPTSAIAVIGLPGSWATAGQGPTVLRAAGRPPPS
jgi:phosphohistidine phosphatase